MASKEFLKRRNERVEVLMNRRELTEYGNGKWFIKEYDEKGNYIRLECDDDYVYHLEYDDGNNIVRAWYEGFFNHKKKLDIKK